MPRKARKYSVTVRLALTQDQKRITLNSRLGKSTKLGITQFVMLLLQANERLAKCQKMTDETIKAAIIAEYPEHRTAKKLAEGKITVGYWRSIYNCGGFWGKSKPKPSPNDPDRPKSYRYAHNGERIISRKGRTRRTLSDLRQQERRKKQRAEYRKQKRIQDRILAKDFEKYARQLANAFVTIAWEHHIQARNEQIAQRKAEKERKRLNAVTNRKNFGKNQKVRVQGTSDREVEFFLQN